jgi:hypothetical protein
MPQLVTSGNEYDQPLLPLVSQLSAIAVSYFSTVTFALPVLLIQSLTSDS